MIDEFTEVVTRMLVGRLAMAAGATEAVGMRVEHGTDGKPSLKLVTHIRPGEVDPETRGRALAAFEEIALPCVEAGRPGSFQVSPDTSATGPWFCLVLPYGRNGRTLLVISLIVRAVDKAAARAKLQAIWRR